ncbi:acyl-CoA thioesterase II [Blastococcus sp. TF02A-26]|uniref:acyl-CoA thioesterase n=1 Tax=Blastococcus sp. TF02A-26 TaxID=2250577 RepID=UPI0013146DA1|nr:acyl-CoA thioesterase domain-containing protein [Blastococcus sp. TF02A-26]
MSDLPELLQLTEIGDRRLKVFQPAESAEGRDVVFSGQLLGQLMMASDRYAGGKDVRSVHAVFARAGSYRSPIELEVESLQAGRTWASDTVTARQDGRLLCRATVLLNVLDDDLMRHGPAMPDVPGWADLSPDPRAQAFPGAEVRPVPGEPMDGDVPLEAAWHRYDRPLVAPAANQAVLAWATCGQLIGLAVRPHSDTVDFGQAHVTLSTGVIGHTLHFLERFDVSRPLLITQEATKAATGRVYGRGSVFTEDGVLVAAFEQDSMAKHAGRSLDPRTAM